MTKEEIIDYLYENNVHADIKIEDMADDLAESTLYGFPLQHLELIAIILQKENLPPERVKECLTDIERIVDIVHEEFEESLRRSVLNNEST